MKNLLVICALFVCSIGLCQDLGEAAKCEALRRGNHIERVGGGPEGEGDTLAEVTAAPENDSYKWHISVITTANCKPCERLKYDFANSAQLKAFVDKTHGNSHYAVYRIEDASQGWRFQDVKFKTYPAIVIQPPRNGMYGPEGDYLEPIYGYDGNDKKLAKEIVNKMAARASAYKRASQRALVRGAEAGHEPQFMVLPPDSDGERPLADRQETRSVGALVDSILSFTPLAFFPGNELAIVAAIVGAVLVIRNYRKSKGKTLLIDDAAASKIADEEKKIISQLAAKYGLTIQPSPG